MTWAPQRRSMPASPINRAVRSKRRWSLNAGGMRLPIPEMAVALWVGGCAGVQSPPVRGLHASMPGLLSNRQMEIGASIGGWGAPMLVPHAGLQLSDGFGLEAGLNAGAV